MQQGKTEKIIRVLKKRGFVFPSNEIYGGTAGFYDLGPLGVSMKNKIENFWKDFFVRNEDNIYEVYTRTISPEIIFIASGHVRSFTDPVTTCKSCKSAFRADHLIQEVTGEFVELLKIEELTQKLRENDIKCPKCKGELSDISTFQMMFRTNIGVGEGNTAYLRPETAQGIFVNFLNVANAMRAKLPFGIAQIGVSYRNEISPRQYLIRLREFVQFEIEFFFNPNKINEKEYSKFNSYDDVKIRILTRDAQKQKSEEIIEITAGEAVEKGIVPNKIMAYFLAKGFLWFQQLGIPAEALRFRHLLPEETPFYSKGNFDLEILSEFGWKESVGNAYRTDYDLSQHMKLSGKDMSIMDGKEKIIAHVVEPSFGLERPLWGIFFNCFVEDKERGWNWFRFPPKIAPYIAGIFPLMKKDNLPEKAKEIYQMLKKGFDVFYDDSGSIGKRYARADEIGTFLGITIDYQTLEDDTVTIRNRDNMLQIRVKIKDLAEVIRKLMDQEIKFEEAGEPVKT